MEFETAANRFLSHFGIKNQCDKLAEETTEVIEAIQFGDMEERIDEIADLRNLVMQMEVYTAEQADISLKVLDALIVEARVKKNHRTEERIRVGWYK